MTRDQFLDLVFVREGDTYGDTQTQPPIDQPTGRGGITLPTLRRYITANPGSALTPTVGQLQTLTHAEARKIVAWTFDELAHHTGLAAIAFEPLRLQMLDWGYNSGAALAIRWLQRVLGVPRTGVMDPATVTAVNAPDDRRYFVLLHQAVIAARLEMVDRWTDGSAKDKPFEEGVESRAVSFSLLEVP